MDAKLKEAIEIVENFGGFVLFPEDHQEEKEIRQRTFDMEREQEIKAEEERIIDASISLKERNELIQSKKRAFREMDKAMSEPHFLAQGVLNQMEQLEDMLLDEGLEPDYLEEWINSQI